MQRKLTKLSRWKRRCCHSVVFSMIWSRLKLQQNMQWHRYRRYNTTEGWRFILCAHPVLINLGLSTTGLPYYNTVKISTFNKTAVLSQRWPRDARYISRSWAVAEIYGHSKLSKMAAAAILNLFESKIAPLDPPSPKTPPYNQTWSGSDDRLRRYGHLKFFQDGGSRHLGFVWTGNSAIRYTVPENPTLEPNMKWIGSPVAEISYMAIRICLGHVEPPFLGEGEVVGGQR